MTTIDGVPGRWRPWLPGVAQAPAEALAAAEGCTVPELVAQLILDAAAKTAASTTPQSPTGNGDGEALADGTGEVTTVGECGGSPVKPSVAAIYTDPDGDQLTLLALHDRPADWSLVLTTADGEVERDLWFEDDETLAGWCRMGLGAIEDRRR